MNISFLLFFGSIFFRKEYEWNEILIDLDLVLMVSLVMLLNVTSKKFFLFRNNGKQCHATFLNRNFPFVHTF